MRGLCGYICRIDIILIIVSLVVEGISLFFVLKCSKRYERRKINMLIEQNNLLQKSLKESEQTFEIWKQSIHDYKNNIIVLTQLAEDGKIDEIKKYLKQENELISQDIFYIKTGNAAIDAILNAKQNLTKKNNIFFAVNINLPPDITISDMDFAGILGNLIDNAIEAEQNEEEPYIELNIKQEKQFLLINIKNKYTKSSSVKTKTNKTNSELHGIGLKSVKRIVKKYNGNLVIDVKDMQFIVNILLQNG